MPDHEAGGGFERARLQNVFDLAEVVGDGEDWPLLPDDVDLDVSLSRDLGIRPFHFAIDHDSLLVQVAGEAEIRFRHPDVRRFRVVPGDVVYLPAGLEHRLMPRSPSLALRYCAGRQHDEWASVWCGSCGHRIEVVRWDSASRSRREGMAAARDACRELAGRPCPDCGEPVSADPGPALDAYHLADREPSPAPLHASALWAGHLMTSQSAPLFPRLGRGAIVPCVGMTYGTEHPFAGSFHHRNSVDEVILVLGANGVKARAGTVRVLDREHEVRNAMSDPYDPESYVMTLIVQRQSETAGQSESFWLTCEACGAELVERTSDVDPPTSAPLPGFNTLLLAGATVEGFNRDVEARRCRSCGVENPPFDADGTGWSRYVARLRTANAAARALGTPPLTG